MHFLALISLFQWISFSSLRALKRGRKVWCGSWWWRWRWRWSKGKVGRKTRVLGRVNIVKMSQFDLNSNRINKYNAIVWSRDHQESYKQFSSSRIRDFIFNYFRVYHKSFMLHGTTSLIWIRLYIPFWFQYWLLGWERSRSNVWFW